MTTHISTIALLLLVPALTWTTPSAGALRITEENDSFVFSDDEYTQGLEVEYMTRWKDDKRTIYALRNQFYTPEDITVSEPQPKERPWAGLTALALRRQRRYTDYTRTLGLTVGALGEWSRSGDIQTWVHGVVGSKRPKGWRNQYKGGPAANIDVLYIVPVATHKLDGGLQADLALTGGAGVGNIYTYGETGVIARFGLHPPAHSSSTVSISNLHRLSLYMFTRTGVKYVLYNHFISGSLFNGGPERDQVPVVADLQAGLAARLRNAFNSRVDLGFKWAATCRTLEYKQQDNLNVFGTLQISIGTDF